MSRTTGDLTTPLGRIVTPDEAAALRQSVRRNLRGTWRTTLGLWAVLAGFFGVVGWLVWWGNPREGWRQAFDVQAVWAVIATIMFLYQARRLLSLRDIGSLEVHRAVSAVYKPYARLFSPAAFRSQRLSNPTYRLHPLAGGALSPEYVWQLDLVRVRHGGPEQFFVLAAAPLRPASEAERQQVNAYLWEIGIYRQQSD